MTVTVRQTYTISGETTMSTLFYLPSEKGSSLKENNLFPLVAFLSEKGVYSKRKGCAPPSEIKIYSKRGEFAPYGSKFFPFRAETFLGSKFFPFSVDPFQERLGMEESKQEVTKRGIAGWKCQKIYKICEVPPFTVYSQCQPYIHTVKTSLNFPMSNTFDCANNNHIK